MAKDEALERLKGAFKKPEMAEIKVRLAATEKNKLMARARKLNKTLSGFCAEILFMIANLSDRGLLAFIDMIEEEAQTLKGAKKVKGP